MSPDEQEQKGQEEKAIARFNILSLSRFAALAVVLLGAATIAGRIFASAPPALGYTLFVVGVIDFFLMPVVLRKIWAQQDEKNGLK